jgi:hypothetical protein
MSAFAARIKTYLSMTTAGVWFAMIAKGAAAQAQAPRVVTVKLRLLEAEERSNGPLTAGLESRDRWGDADVETEYVTCLEVARLQLQRQDR